MKIFCRNRSLRGLRIAGIGHIPERSDNCYACNVHGINHESLRNSLVVFGIYIVRRSFYDNVIASRIRR